METVGQMADPRYYVESQRSARHPNDYYPGGGEPDGVWWNPQGVLGLKDGEKVDSRDWYRLSAGYDLDPKEKKALVRLAGSDKRSAGLDLTFSADKSISALWAISPKPLRDEIRSCVKDAAIMALEDITTPYCSYTRKGGRVIPADLFGAIWEHSTSRENDPQLHVHCTILNLARTHEDGIFRSVHQYPMYKWKMAGGATFRNRLAWLLQERLGIRMEQYGRNNAFTRIAGIPEEYREGWDKLLQFWSKRRGQILAKARESGFDVEGNAARAAALNKITRGLKPKDTDVEKFHEEWCRLATDFVKHIQEFIAQVTGHKIEITQDQIRELTEAIEALPGKLTQEEAVFHLTDIFMHTENASAGLVARHATPTLRERLRLSEDVTPLQPKPSPEAVAGMAHTQVYTTRDTIELEIAVQTMAQRMESASGYALPVAAVQQKFQDLADQNYPLSGEQRLAIQAATSSSGSIAVIEGAAGSGKTTTLRPIADLFRAHGHTMIATAVPWRVAVKLSSDCDIPPYSVSKLLKDASRGQLHIDRKTVILVDEAGMLSTRQMHHLLKLSEKHGAKLVLAGDTQQQQPVEAGPGLRLVCDITGSARVEKIRRQKADLEDVLTHVHGASTETARVQVSLTSHVERDRLLAEYEAMPKKPSFTPWQVGASEAFRDGEPASGLEAYNDRGRFHLAQTDQAAVTQLVQDWARFRKENPAKTTAVMARTNAERQAISYEMREHLLGGKKHLRTVTVQVSCKEEDGRVISPLEIAVGDRLRIGAAHHGERLYNGDIVTVEDFKVRRPVFANTDDISVLIVGRMDDGRKVRFHHDEIRDFYGNIRLDHGYALTITSAQGLTVDQAFLFVDANPARETIYPAMTRHSEGLDIYTGRQNHVLQIVEKRHESEKEDPVTDQHVREYLAKQWSREQPKEAALDYLSETNVQRLREKASAKTANANTARPAATQRAANDNSLRGLVRKAHTSILNLQYGTDVARLAAGRTSVTQAYGRLRTQYRTDGNAVALTEEFTATLSHHAALLKSAQPFRDRPWKFNGVLSTTGGLSQKDLTEFERLYRRASQFRSSAAISEGHQRRLRMDRAMQAPVAETSNAEARRQKEARDTAGPASPEVRPARQSHKWRSRYSSAAELSLALRGRVEDVCRTYLPLGTRSGNRWLIGNVAGETSTKGGLGSLYVNLSGESQGKWIDTATQEKGDLLDLIKANRRFATNVEAMDEARQFLGTAAPVPQPQTGTRKQTQTRRKAAATDTTGIQRFLEGAKPLQAGDPATLYLQGRGLSPELAPQLRYHPRASVRAQHGDKNSQRLPALLAPIRTPDGALEAVHRYFLTKEGSLSPVTEPNSKRNMGSPVAGGVWLANPKAGRVVITEGLEDALSVLEAVPKEQHKHFGVVASLSSGRLGSVALPGTARELILLQDRDAAGEAAWASLQQQYKDSGIALSRILPVKKDANDDLRQLGRDSLAKTLAPLTAGLGGEREGVPPAEREKPAAEDLYLRFREDWEKNRELAKREKTEIFHLETYPGLIERIKTLAARADLPQKRRQTLSRALATHEALTGPFEIFRQLKQDWSRHLDLADKHDVHVMYTKGIAGLHDRIRSLMDEKHLTPTVRQTLTTILQEIEHARNTRQYLIDYVATLEGTIEYHEVSLPEIAKLASREMTQTETYKGWREAAEAIKSEGIDIMAEPGYWLHLRALTDLRQRFDKAHANLMYRISSDDKVAGAGDDHREARKAAEGSSTGGPKTRARQTPAHQVAGAGDASLITAGNPNWRGLHSAQRTRHPRFRCPEPGHRAVTSK